MLKETKEGMGAGLTNVLGSKQDTCPGSAVMGNNFSYPKGKTEKWSQSMGPRPPTSHPPTGTTLVVIAWSSFHVQSAGHCSTQGM